LQTMQNSRPWDPKLRSQSLLSSTCFGSLTRPRWCRSSSISRTFGASTTGSIFSLFIVAHSFRWAACDRAKLLTFPPANETFVNFETQAFHVVMWRNVLALNIFICYLKKDFLHNDGSPVSFPHLHLCFLGLFALPFSRGVLLI